MCQSCRRRNNPFVDWPSCHVPVAYIVAFTGCRGLESSHEIYHLNWYFVVEAMGLEPTNLLTASQALYQLSYAPVARLPR